ncbi:MAG: hypothetical protein ISP49_17250 [Reyranella sp.]|nr:hypothetical protein [Reyranella sp.]
MQQLPAALYVTDRDGRITWYNKACIDLAGRTPEVKVDCWCVTWKLLTDRGEPSPHDQCPMALAIRDGVRSAVKRRSPSGRTVGELRFDPIRRRCSMRRGSSPAPSTSWRTSRRRAGETTSWPMPGAVGGCPGRSTTARPSRRCSTWPRNTKHRPPT